MRTQSRSGFTIIEVMLFLAITGALTVGILVGSGVAINQQRYRDSVNSFKSLLQEQYGQITNVINVEAENPLCNRSGTALVFNDDNQQARGTSECVVLGRFMLIESTQTIVHTVVGQADASAASNDDSTVLGNYALATRSPEAREMSWSARIVTPKTTDGSTTSVLIVRSPLSGSILTYVQDGDRRSALRDMISDANMTQKDFCVDSGGMSALGSRQAVRITAKASTQSAIETPLEGDNVCD